MNLGVMAVTGCFAGQLFNLLVGFGVALTNTTARKHDPVNGGLLPIKFDLFNLDQLKENTMELIVIGFAFLNLIITFSYLVVNKWNISKNYVIFCYIYYGLFCFVCIAF